MPCNHTRNSPVKFEDAAVMNSRTKACLALAVAMFGFAPIQARPQTAGYSSPPQSYGSAGGYGDVGRKRPCDNDFAKFCSDVDKYGMRQCILDHQAEFSASCKAQREADREAAERQKYPLPPVIYSPSTPSTPHGG